LQRSRHADLYIAETREHLSLLGRGILGLERGTQGALDEAFRAAHTIKGLGAAMGYQKVASLSHTLEDRLTDVRDGRRAMDAALIDELLSMSDALGEAAESTFRGPQPEDGGAAQAVQQEAVSSPVSDAGSAPAPPLNATVTARVLFEPDTPIRAARAGIVRRNADRVGGVVGSWPDPGVDAGELQLHLSPAADLLAMEKAIRTAGHVADVRFEPCVTRPPERSPDRVEEAEAVAWVRVPRDRLDDLAEGIAELSVLHERKRLANGERATSDRAGPVLAELQRVILDLRMVPVSVAFERFHRLVRDALRSVGKEADFVMEGAGIAVDQAILDAIVDPLVHLLRNAIDHGLEAPDVREASGKPRRGKLRLETRRERSSVRITVADDGAGIARDRVLALATRAKLIEAGTTGVSDEELFRLMSQPGFSTAESVTELSGRGVGLDVVVARVRSLGGAIEMTSTEHEGTTFTIRLPVTLSLAHALRIRVGGEDYAIALTHVTEAVTMQDQQTERQDGRETIALRGERIALVRLGNVLGARVGNEAAAVVAELGERRVALAVDELIGHEKIVVKSFDAAVGTLPLFSGATILADGRPALLIDPLSVA
jgi:two-component system chemotaxis sensor kinase CheA